MKAFPLMKIKWLVAPMLAVTGIGLMMCYYTFVHVPNRTDYVSGRNLRILATISTQIHSNIENNNNMMLHTKGKDEVRYSINRIGSTTSLRISNHAKKPKDLPFDSLAVFKHPEFDILLVADEKGSVLFHKGPDEIQIRTLDQLTPVSDDNKDKTAPAAKKATDSADDESTGSPSDKGTVPPIAMSEVRDVTIVGQAYKLFLVPAKLPIHMEEDKSTPGVSQWVIVGLVKTSRFLSECTSISYTLRSFIICLMVIVFVSIPLVRMLTLENRERVSALNIRMLAYSLLMGTALFTLFVADMFVYAKAEDRLNAQAHTLAERIADNVKEELGMAYLQLNTLTLRALPELQQAREGNKPHPPAPNILKDRVMLSKDPYPYFHMAVWADAKGEQRVKWTIKSEATPFVDISQRPYFQHAKENRTWTVSLDETTGPPSARFWAEPVYSWTTAENVTQVAMPLSEVTDAFPNWVAALEIKPLSLMNPILPKGFSYALIDRTGAVLFHSEENRALRENLLTETTGSPLIKEVLAGHSAKAGDGVYRGHDQYLVVKPFHQIPWTLVVFRDKQPLRTANAEALTSSTILLLLYTLVMSLLWTVGWIAYRIVKSSQEYRSAWLWMDQGRNHTYRTITMINIGLSLILVAFMWRGSGWYVAATAVLLPCLAVGFAIMQWRRGSSHGDADTGVILRSYTWAVVSFLFILAVLPALAFFKVAYEMERELIVKQAQLSLAAGLHEREARIKKKYQEVQMADDQRDAFFRKRGETKRGETRLDNYYEFFAGTKLLSIKELPRPSEEGSTGNRSFRWLLEMIRIPFNDSAVEASGLMQDDSDDRTLAWASTTEGQLILSYRPPEGVSKDSLNILLGSVVPKLLDRRDVVFSVLAAVVLGLALFRVVGRIGRTIFAADLMNRALTPSNSGAKGKAQENLLVLSPAPSRDMSIPAEAHQVDLASAITDDSWVDTVRADIAKSPVSAVAFRNWDYQMDNPTRNRQKLLLLHELLSQEQRLLIHSRRDLSHLVLNGETENWSDGTWAHATRSFLTIYPAEDSGDPSAFDKVVRKFEEQALQSLARTDGAQNDTAQETISTVCRVLQEECQATARLQAIGRDIGERLDLTQATPEDIRQAIARAASGHYQQLWNTCSIPEQYILFALARDGFIKTSQAEVGNLLRRGLIKRDPILCLMNETLSQWILEEGRAPTYAQTWKKAEPQRTWTSARQVLLLILAATGLFLYRTQGDDFGSMVEFGTALFAGIPIITEWLGQLQGEKAVAAV